MSIKHFQNIFEIIIEFNKKIGKIHNFNYYFDTRLSIGNMTFPILITYDLSEESESIDIKKIYEILSFIPSFTCTEILEKGFYKVDHLDNKLKINSPKNIKVMDICRNNYEQFMNEIEDLEDESKSAELKEFMSKYNLSLESDTIVIQSDNYLKYSYKYKHIIQQNINEALMSIGNYIVYDSKNTFPRSEHLAVVDFDNKVIKNWMYY